MADDTEVELRAAEDDLTGLVNDVLDDVAVEFAREIRSADVLTAAFSVSRIAGMFTRRLPRIVRQLLGIVETSAGQAATDVGEQLPPGWTDLPGRYDDGDPLPAAVQQYVDTTDRLLAAVGERLAHTARTELAAGLDAGENHEQLTARLRAAFAADGTQLGPGRARNIAVTEAGRAWNNAALAAARAVQPPGRPLVKQWVTRGDDRVRDSHRHVNGQIQLLDEPFDVGGVLMDAPGDPTAPASLVIGCRCVLAVAPASDRITAATPTLSFVSQEPSRAGFKNQRKEPVTVSDPVTAAAADGSPHTGAMLALMPTARDAARLAVDGGEPAEELHLTLFYLGEAADWTDEQRQELIVNVRNYGGDYLTGLIQGQAFGANHWNPHGDEPCWVWPVGDDQTTEHDGLQAARRVALAALDGMRDQPELPDQHSPWQPHVAAIYSGDPSMLGELTDRLGPITFDRLRVAFAGDSTDIPLVRPQVTAAAVEEPRGWSTPGDTALVFEGEETGDGRVFALNSLYWESGPWPLQYAEEMLGGHEGAELAGSIAEMSRDGGRIGGSGVLYPGQSAGADAITLLEQEAPLGVSVDLDDVSVEFLQRRPEVSGQVDLPSAMMSVCPQCTTTTSAEAASASTATNPTQNTVFAAAADSSNRAENGSNIWTRDGSTKPATHSSADAGNFPATPASTALNPSNRASQSSAHPAADTRPNGPTGFKSADTTSGTPTGSPHPKQSASSQSRTASAPSAASASASSTPTSSETRPTSTTAMAADATERSSVSPVTQDSETSRTTSHFSNAQPHTCACTRTDETQYEVALAASLATASVLQLPDGTWVVRGIMAARWTASGESLLRSTRTVEWTTAADGSIPAAALHQVLAEAGVTAAAGDPDDPTKGEVVHTESAGDLLMRITRGRVRGATLVAMPAYNRARIVLDPPTADVTAACAPPEDDDRDLSGQVIAYVSTSPVPVGARELSRHFGITMTRAAGYLTRAAETGRLVRLARGLYVGASTLPEGIEDISAAMSGDLALPIHDDRNAAWNGPEAGSRVLDWATDSDGNVDPDRLGTAFLYRDENANPQTLGAYKLGMADIYGGELHIVPNGVYAVAGALQGARGGVDIPQDEHDRIKTRVETLYARIGKKFDEPDLRAPWTDETASGDLEASAWAMVRQAPPMPAAWFREPTPEELPPGSGGVHYVGGRIFGWVAQAGEPHAGFPDRTLTIESLGRIDLSHFLRQRFSLDDGTTVKAGAFTMNVGHHRDGAECETASCQFDDTRTVAGVVTVGMSQGGMWFSGAAAPYLSEWDRTVFAACQPSYHMKQGQGGRWQLRAVLSVPVPGHSSPLVAAFTERANMALAASSAASTVTPPAPDEEEPPAVPLEQAPPVPAPRSEPAPDLSASLAALLADPELLDALVAALRYREDQVRAEIDAMAAEMEPVRQEITASGHGGTVKADAVGEGSGA